MTLPTRPAPRTTTFCLLTFFDLSGVRITAPDSREIVRDRMRGAHSIVCEDARGGDKLVVIREGHQVDEDSPLKGKKAEQGQLAADGDAGEVEDDDAVYGLSPECGRLKAILKEEVFDLGASGGVVGSGDDVEVVDLAVGVDVGLNHQGAGKGCHVIVAGPVMEYW